MVATEEKEDCRRKGKLAGGSRPQVEGRQLTSIWSFPGVEMVAIVPTDGIPNDNSLVESTDELHPANLIPALCRSFYKLGWVTGTGGGISIRDGQAPSLFFPSPSLR